MKLLFVVSVLVAVLVTSASQASPTDQTTGARATLRTFAGTWYGHTRSLKITLKGVASESVGAGCCDPIIDLKFRLSHARGTSTKASATAHLSAVTIHDKTAFTTRNPAPRVGQTKRLRLRNGVITEPFIGTNYCDRRAGQKGTCGA